MQEIRSETRATKEATWALLFFDVAMSENGIRLWRMARRGGGHREHRPGH